MAMYLTPSRSGGVVSSSSGVCGRFNGGSSKLDNAFGAFGVHSSSTSCSIRQQALLRHTPVVSISSCPQKSVLRKNSLLGAATTTASTTAVTLSSQQSTQTRRTPTRTRSATTTTTTTTAGVSSIHSKSTTSNKRNQVLSTSATNSRSNTPFRRRSTMSNVNPAKTSSSIGNGSPTSNTAPRVEVGSSLRLEQQLTWLQQQIQQEQKDENLQPSLTCLQSHDEHRESAAHGVSTSPNGKNKTNNHNHNKFTVKEIANLRFDVSTLSLLSRAMTSSSSTNSNNNHNTGEETTTTTALNMNGGVGGANNRKQQLHIHAAVAIYVSKGEDRYAFETITENEEFAECSQVCQTAFKCPRLLTFCGVFDGHDGPNASRYCAKGLLQHVLMETVKQGHAAATGSGESGGMPVFGKSNSFKLLKRKLLGEGSDHSCSSSGSNPGAVGAAAGSSTMTSTTTSTSTAPSLSSPTTATQHIAFRKRGGGSTMAAAASAAAKLRAALAEIQAERAAAAATHTGSLAVESRDDPTDAHTSPTHESSGLGGTGEEPQEGGDNHATTTTTTASAGEDLTHKSTPVSSSSSCVPLLQSVYERAFEKAQDRFAYDQEHGTPCPEPLAYADVLKRAATLNNRRMLLNTMHASLSPLSGSFRRRLGLSSNSLQGKSLANINAGGTTACTLAIYVSNEDAGASKLTTQQEDSKDSSDNAHSGLPLASKPDIFCLVANCGDSRCLSDDGSGTADFHPVSTDHRPDDPREEVRLEEAKANVSYVGRVQQRPRIFPGGLAVSRSIGDVAYSPAVIPKPDVFHIPLTSSTTATDSHEQEQGKPKTTTRRFVIASDGLWDVVTNERVGELAARKKAATATKSTCSRLAADFVVSPYAAASKLMQECCRPAHCEEYLDDITILVIDVTVSEEE